MEKTIHDHYIPIDDLWRYDDDPLDNIHDDPLPEDGADPECAECGGQGGWLRYVGRYDQETEWVECDCVGG